MTDTSDLQPWLCYTPLGILYEIVDLVTALKLWEYEDWDDMPEAVNDIGFSHEGTHVMVPNASSCMRFPVDPYKEYGRGNVLLWMMRAKAYLGSLEEEVDPHATRTARAVTLPLRYGGIDWKSREVALFTAQGPGDKKYAFVYTCRGPWQEALPVARHGFRPIQGGDVSHTPEECRFVLDCPSWGVFDDDGAYHAEHDRSDLTWHGPRLTAEEFLEWATSQEEGGVE